MKKLLLIAPLAAALTWIAWRAASETASPPRLYNPDMAASAGIRRVPPPPNAILFSPPGSAPAAAKQSPAADLYAWRCAICHGADGQGDGYTAQQPGMPEIGNLATSAKTDDELRRDIAEGRGAMPAFGSRLSGREIEVLLQEIKKLRRP